MSDPFDRAEPSAAYRLIWKAVREREQIVFSYNGHPREACPIILGYSSKGEEVVFAYQFSGSTSQQGTLPNWRCFHLVEIAELKARKGWWFEGTRHTKPQACVIFVDVDSNIPETLIRLRPLRFGASELRPPREN